MEGATSGSPSRKQEQEQEPRPSKHSEQHRKNPTSRWEPIAGSFFSSWSEPRTPVGGPAGWEGVERRRKATQNATKIDVEPGALERSKPLGENPRKRVEERRKGPS